MFHKVILCTYSSVVDWGKQASIFRGRVNRNRYCAIQYQPDIRYPFSVRSLSLFETLWSLSLGRAVGKTVMSPSTSPGWDWLLYFHTMCHRPNCTTTGFQPQLCERKSSQIAEWGAGINNWDGGLHKREEERGPVFPQDRFFELAPYFTRALKNHLAQCKAANTTPLYETEPLLRSGDTQQWVLPWCHYY